MKKIVTLIVFILIVHSAMMRTILAQVLPQKTPVNNSLVTELAKPQFQVYTEKDGLPKNSVFTVAVDTKGYLWAGTLAGAAYYNGRKWATINMPNYKVNNEVCRILPTANDGIWFGTQAGGLHHLKNGKWESFNQKSGTLPNDIVTDLLESIDAIGKATLWVGTRGGLAKYQDGQWTSFTTKNSALINNKIRCLLETVTSDNKKVLWVGTEEGLAKYQDGQWSSFTTKNSALINDSIICLLESSDTDGKKLLWLGTEKGLCKYQEGQWSSITNKNSNISNTPIYCMSETIDIDGHKILWLGTLDAGLIKFENNRWSNYGTKNSNLPNNKVYKLLETKTAAGQRTLWIATFGGGLAKLAENLWNYFDTKNSGLTNDEAYQILKTKNANGQEVLWVPTFGGLFKFENGQWTAFTVQNSKITDNTIARITEYINKDHQSTLWLATQAGLCKFENNSWTTYNTENSPLPNNNVMDIVKSVDAEGRLTLWIATFMGLVKFEVTDNRWTIYNTENSGISSNNIYTVLSTKDAKGKETIWAGTFLGGLCRFEDNKWTTFNTKNSSLPFDDIASILESKNSNGKCTLWIGTYGGGVCYFNTDAINEKWVVLNDETIPALPNNNVNAVVKDNREQIYICTLKGILRLTPRKANAYYAEDFNSYTFTTDDGLPSNEINPRAIMLDEYGFVWVGTFKGVAILDPDKVIVDETIKPLLLERTLVNGKEFSKDDKEPHLIGTDRDSLANQILAYNQNSITFEYALLNYLKEQETLYQTQLIGVNDKPSDWTSDNKQPFYNLGAGNYIFKVWGKDYAGNISGPLSISFQIKPAPWFTWWAYSFYIILLCLTIYYATQFYIRSLQQKNEQLEIKIKERTNTIAQQKEDLVKKNAELISSEQRALDSEKLALDSEKRALTSEKKALEANKAKSTFLANMNHELRTPLNAILGFVQLMEREPNRTRPDKEKLSIIMTSGEHLLGLINDVLSISKIEAGQITLNKQNFNLIKLLENLAEMFKLKAQAKNLLFEVNYGDDLPQYVNGDEGRLRQVLINLLGNAFKFTEQGKISLNVSFQDERACFIVQDTGQGIEEQELSKLFVPFVQTQSGLKATEGTGLGLAISRNLINLMEGDISVKSEYGKGSTFSFEINLPMALLAEDIVQERKVLSLAPGQEDYRLLITDDVEENRIFLAELLSSVGFRVRYAANGAEAVRLWEEWHPHLIWMDMRMPVMDGNEATRIIREKEQANNTMKQYGRTVIIALTASSFAHDRSTIIANGCDDFVPKPFKINTIFEKLAQRLGIDFIFEEDLQNDIAQLRLTDMEGLTASALLSLPSKLLNQLSDSIINGDVEAATKVTEQIKIHDQQIAQSLELMIKNYKFEEILDLMGQNP